MAAETRLRKNPRRKQSRPRWPFQDSLLGKETTVLLFGDLAKNGKQQFLAANVVPKSSKNNLPGTIVTRAVVAANEDGKWMEILRCDEHLKNQKGFLPGTPIGGVTGWRLAFGYAHAPYRSPLES